MPAIRSGKRKAADIHECSANDFGGTGSASIVHGATQSFGPASFHLGGKPQAATTAERPTIRSDGNGGLQEASTAECPTNRSDGSGPVLKHGKKAETHAECYKAISRTSH